MPMRPQLEEGVRHAFIYVEARQQCSDGRQQAINQYCHWLGHDEPYADCRGLIHKERLILRLPEDCTG